MLNNDDRLSCYTRSAVTDSVCFSVFDGKSSSSSSVETDCCSLGRPSRTRWLRWVAWMCVGMHSVCAHVSQCTQDTTVDIYMLLLLLSSGPCCTSSCPHCLIPMRSLTSGSPRTSRATLKTSLPSMRVSTTHSSQKNNVPLSFLLKFSLTFPVEIA